MSHGWSHQVDRRSNKIEEWPIRNYDFWEEEKNGTKKQSAQRGTCDYRILLERSLCCPLHRNWDDTQLYLRLRLRWWNGIGITKIINVMMLYCRRCALVRFCRKTSFHWKYNSQRCEVVAASWSWRKPIVCEAGKMHWPSTHGWNWHRSV